MDCAASVPVTLTVENAIDVECGEVAVNKNGGRGQPCRVTSHVGSAAAYDWRAMDGASDAWLSSTTVAAPDFDAPAAAGARHEYRLTASVQVDGAIITASGIAGFSSASGTPFSVSCTNVSVQEGSTVLLSNCTIIEGSLTRRPYTYAWSGSSHLTNTSRSHATFDAGSISIDDDQTYDITLTVTDPTQDGKPSASGSFTLTVTDADNITPSCKPKKYSRSEGDGTITFSGCGASVSDGGSPTYSWSWTGDLPLTDANTDMPTVTIPGNVTKDTDYLFTATVTAIGYDAGTESVCRTSLQGTMHSILHRKKRRRAHSRPCKEPGWRAALHQGYL